MYCKVKTWYVLNFGEKIKLYGGSCFMLSRSWNYHYPKILKSLLAFNWKVMYVYQNLSKYLQYSRPAGTIIRCNKNKKPYVISLLWNKYIYELAILIHKRLYKLYKTVTTILIWYVIPLSIELVMSWTYITFDKTIAVFSTHGAVLKFQQSLLTNNQSQHHKNENKTEIIFIDWLMTSIQLLSVFRWKFIFPI